MAYDKALEERLESLLQGQSDITKKTMFGGISFLSRGHMLCGVVSNKLCARVGLDYYPDALKQPHAYLMDFTGRPMKGMVFVGPDGIKTKKQLRFWVDKCLAFVDSLPNKEV